MKQEEVFYMKIGGGLGEDNLLAVTPVLLFDAFCCAVFRRLVEVDGDNCEILKRGFVQMSP